MTNLQLYYRFLQRLEENIRPSLSIRTIDVEYYLNEGYRVFTEDYADKFEKDEAARKRLSPLVASLTLTRTTGTPSTNANNHTGGEYWTLPATVRYVVQEEATLSYMDCHSNPATIRSSVKPVKLDYVNQHITNPFKRPYLHLIWRLDVGSRIHELMTATGQQVSLYHLTYIKNPATITLLTGTPETTSIEIAGEFHEEIIDRAINVALEVYRLTNTLKQSNN